MVSLACLSGAVKDVGRQRGGRARDLRSTTCPYPGTNFLFKIIFEAFYVRLFRGGQVGQFPGLQHVSGCGSCASGRRCGPARYPVFGSERREGS